MLYRAFSGSVFMLRMITDVHIDAQGATGMATLSVLPHHPASELFPMMSEKELRDLTDDILANGLLNDIIIYDGHVLDGRSRQIACQRAEIEPRYREWDSKGSLTAFVIAQNLRRRHLSRDQMVAIAVESLTLFEAEAEQRLHLSQGRGKKGASDDATFRGKASEAAADAFGVSARQIERAKAVKKQHPEKFEQIKRGDLTVTEGLADITNDAKTEELARLRALWTPTEASRLDERRLIQRADAFEFLKSPPWPIDHVVTDPLYGKEHLWMFEPLAEQVAKILPPHGLFVCMVGQLWLPEIIAALSKHLRYRWTVAYLLPTGKSTTVRAHADANPFWKPVLVFGNTDIGWINKDIVQSDPIDSFWKSKHPYAQCPSGFERLLETLQIRPGQVVCDPFMGTSVTGAAALRRLCRYIGCDVQQEYVDASELRLSQEWDSLRKNPSAEAV
jgi:hypothetical protein